MHWYQSIRDYRAFEQDQQQTQMPNMDDPNYPSEMPQQGSNPMQHIGSHRDPRVTSKVARHGTVITTQ